MKDEKHSRIVAAITVNAVILVFILLVVAIAQLVQINVLKRRKSDLEARYDVLVAQLGEGEEFSDKLDEPEYYEFILEYMDVYGDEDPWNIIPDGGLGD